MNTLGLRCTVFEGRGKVIGIISSSTGCLHQFTYKSPSIFSFEFNSGEILNWHRDNIISLISQFDIDAIAIKKSERDSFGGRPKNSDIFKLYLEGVLLSLAGSIGILNHHYYKNDIKSLLNNNEVFEKSIEDIVNEAGKTNFKNEILAIDSTGTKEALLSVLALEIQYQNA